MIRRQEGFTLVEIGIIVPILMVIALGMFTLMFSYLLTSNREQVRLYQAYDQSSALDRIEGDIRLSTTFLNNLDSALTDPYGSNQTGGSWTYKGADATHRVLIMREYATGNNPLSTIRTPVFQLRGAATNCNRPANLVGPLTYNVIYFVSNSTLYKRTAVNLSARTCQPQYQKLSCPSLTTLGSSSRNNSCQADDEVIARNVSGFTIDYYTNQGTDAPLDAYGTPGYVASSRSVNVTIVNAQASYNGQVSTSSSSRTASQNNTTGGGL